MAATDVVSSSTATTRAKARLANPTDQAFWILRSAFVVAPILFGLDKFFNVMVEWPRYLAPWLDRLVPGNAQEFMYVVGAIEIIAGLVVAVRAGVRRLPGRGVARRHHRQPVDGRSHAFLRRRAAGLRPAARRARARAARGGGSSALDVTPFHASRRRAIAPA